MENTMRKIITQPKKYQLWLDDENIGKFNSIEELATAAGCSKQWLYRTINENNEFTVNKKTYTIK